MKLFRKVLFWCHLTVGVIGGLVIFIMSATGALLTYERQIIAWVDTRNYQTAPPSAGAEKLPIGALLAKVRESEAGAKITSVTVRSDFSEPVAMTLSPNQGASRTVFVNPYNGVVLGEDSKGVRDFFRFIRSWHLRMGTEGDNRPIGRAIATACNFGFLFIVISGIYLWWPRKQSWQQFKQILWFRRKLTGKARDFNWHNVIGFWSFLPLFAVVFSGVVISYQWAGNLVYRVVGENPPQQRGAPANAGQQRGEAGRNNAQNSENEQPNQLNSLWSRAEQQASGWQSITMRLPNSAEASVVFTIDQGTGGEPQKRATLTLDPKSGEVIRWEPFASFTLGRQLRSIMRFTHTGEVLGLVGQTVAGLVSLGACFMVWTGLALSWRRWRAWVRRRSEVEISTEVAADLEKA